MSLFIDTLADIIETDPRVEQRSRVHLDDLTKPPGSLGRLEDLAARYCRIQGDDRPHLGGRRICTFAGDHGVALDGVSAYPPAVTAQMVITMLAGGAAINALARHAGADLRVIDVGVADSLTDAPAHLVRAKVREGTANLRFGPAMSEDEAIACLEVGIREAHRAAEDGVTLLGTGEMGIGNTTSASALMACLLPCQVIEITGRGTGIDDQRLRLKIAAIIEGLTFNGERLTTPLGALAALGGCEIAAITGLILGAATRHIAVVVDGFISSAAALVAWRLCPAARDCCFFSHRSAESGHARFFQQIHDAPILDLGMRLGEGTGAALAMGVIEGAVKCYLEMATFSSAGVAGKECVP